MAKKHVVIVAPGSKVEKAARRTLTYLGQYKHGGSAYGDLGLRKNWLAYQRERAKLGLPAARE